jgi:hypothetical protein
MKGKSRIAMAYAFLVGDDVASRCALSQRARDKRIYSLAVGD